jgi:hypothetical protein
VAPQEVEGEDQDDDEFPLKNPQQSKQQNFKATTSSKASFESAGVDSFDRIENPKIAINFD